MPAQFDFTDSTRADFFLALAQRLDFPLSSRHRILDFGCGRGQNVYHFRSKGLRAYGVDIDDRAKDAAPWCAKITTEQLFSRATLSPYKLPYEDASFDFIFSDHVYEHVMDYDATLREMARVLAPGGISLHIFPSRLRLVESHIKVPFGGAVRNPAWFQFWASMGVGRAWHGTDLSAEEIGKCNVQFTKARVNYLSKRHIKSYAGVHFSECSFVEHLAVKEHLGVGVPGLGSLVGAFHVRVMKLGRPIHAPAEPKKRTQQYAVPR